MLLNFRELWFMRNGWEISSSECCHTVFLVNIQTTLKLSEESMMDSLDLASDTVNSRLISSSDDSGLKFGQNNETHCCVKINELYVTCKSLWFENKRTL